MIKRFGFIAGVIAAATAALVPKPAPAAFVPKSFTFDKGQQTAVCIVRGERIEPQLVDAMAKRGNARCIRANSEAMDELMLLRVAAIDGSVELVVDEKMTMQTGYHRIYVIE